MDQETDSVMQGIAEAPADDSSNSRLPRDRVLTGRVLTNRRSRSASANRANSRSRTDVSPYKLFRARQIPLLTLAGANRFVKSIHHNTRNAPRTFSKIVEYSKNLHTTHPRRRRRSSTPPRPENLEGPIFTPPTPRRRRYFPDHLRRLGITMGDAGESTSSPTWKFTQCFGDKGDVEDITEADIISTVEFDHTGNYLATGDKGGRVVLFERNETKKTCEYKFHTEFQSHEPEFDYLKSLEIEEKINKIKWCRRGGPAHFLLSTNDKTIKLWKVYEKSLKVVAENNLSGVLTPGGPAGGGGAPRPRPRFTNASALRMPRLTHHDTVIAAVPRKNYANAHAYHINSISCNSDGETFISADDLRINLWNLQIQDQSFNIVDIKPANMEELTEVITAAEFHPTACNWFIYASSKGTIKMVDMRQNALCDNHAKLFEQEEDPSTRSFFSEIISSISDVRYSFDGRHILSRDYLTVKIWDVNMERQPVKTIPIHEHLRPRLCDTYENDSIFDKFEVVFSGDAKNVMTGSYNNNFMIYPTDPEKETEVVLQADKSAFKAKKVGVPTPINTSSTTTSPTSSNGNRRGGSRAGSPAGGAGAQGGRMRRETDADQIDFNKKILHMSWHPSEDSIAIAATNNTEQSMHGVIR
ncbi:MAG: protein phosphatase 2A regulatory subunit cdc55 [Peltula sp. TS41687]|nr:MAG: protein phosphatase 2A regulatory subunit cdc55 [Peltula sp. TS41687]